MDTGITRNPDEYMYDILWGESDSMIVRDEEGVEETETEEEREEEEKEEREQREKEEREKREREKKEKEEKEKREKEEKEKREKEAREKTEKEEREREEKERINKYYSMETSEIQKRIEVLQKITQPTKEEYKELTSLFAILSTKLLASSSYSF